MDNYRDAVTVRSYTTKQSVSLNENAVVGNGYRITKVLNKKMWGNLYEAKKEEDTYFVKIFDKSYECSHAAERLQKIDSDFLLPIIEAGNYYDYYYEIYPFIYSETLQRKTITNIDELTKIIYAINEGINALHENGITHGDIKPSNIFWNKQTGKLYLFDYESATFCEDEYITNNAMGTLEYSAPSQQVLNKSIRKPQYDYGSLGLTILDLYTGYVHFSGFTENEIVQEWKTGIVLPSGIPGRLKSLLKGLLQSDEQDRLGYKEVRNWCSNKFINYPSYSEEKKSDIEPFVFGYDGITPLKVSSLEELAECLVKYKSLAIRRYFKSVNNLERMYDFISSIDPEKSKKARQLVKSNEDDIEAAIFKVSNLLGKSKLLIFEDKEYADLGDLIESLPYDEVNTTFVEFIKNGALVYYLRSIGSDSAADIIEQTTKEPFIDDELLYYMLKYRFSLCSSEVQLGEDAICSIEDLVKHIEKNGFMYIQDNSNYPKLCAWLYVNGYANYVKKMKEVVNSYE